jgi:hypothetical protein
MTIVRPRSEDAVGVARETVLLSKFVIFMQTVDVLVKRTDGQCLMFQVGFRQEPGCDVIAFGMADLCKAQLAPVAETLLSEGERNQTRFVSERRCEFMLQADKTDDQVVEYARKFAGMLAPEAEAKKR